MSACSSSGELSEVSPAGTETVGTVTLPSVATTTTSPAVPATELTGDANLDEIARSYFEDVAASRHSESAEPGSPADFYSEYLSALGPAAQSTWEVASSSSGGISINTKFADGTSSSYDFTEIEVSEAGVRTFTVNDMPLIGRIAVGTERLESEGVAVLKAISYLTVSGSQFAAVYIENSNDTDFDTAGMPSFVDANGRQGESSTFYGAVKVRPGATAPLVFEFPGGDVAGGRIYLDGFVDDFTTPANFVIEVSPFER